MTNVVRYFNVKYWFQYLSLVLSNDFLCAICFLSRVMRFCLNGINNPLSANQKPVISHNFRWLAYLPTGPFRDILPSHDYMSACLPGIVEFVFSYNTCDFRCWSKLVFKDLKQVFYFRIMWISVRYLRFCSFSFSLKLLSLSILEENCGYVFLLLIIVWPAFRYCFCCFVRVI